MMSVMMISGSNLIGRLEVRYTKLSFSYYGGIWGWASWKEPGSITIII